MESAPRDIPRRLPRGTHGLDPRVVAASQRARLLEAVGRAVAEKGYAGAAIDEVVVRRIRESGGADLPELEPVLLHLQVALLAGPEVAAQATPPVINDTEGLHK